MQSPILVYTDGSSLGNPGAGGRAVIIVKGKAHTSYVGSLPFTTNNVMELSAVVAALRILLGKPQHIPIIPAGLFGGDALPHCSDAITLLTDSQYVQKGITERMSARKQRNWKLVGSNQPVKNAPLRQELDYLIGHFSALQLKRVKAHVGNKYNEIADTLAKKAAIKQQ